MTRMSLPGRLGLNVLAYFVAFLMFFPIFWLVLTSFKTNALAAAIHPAFVFTPTIHSYINALVDHDYWGYAWNSVLSSVGSTVLCLILGIPAAYSMAFRRTKRTDFTLLWMKSEAKRS